MFLFRRLFWLIVGFLLGCGASWSITRRVRRAVERYAPVEVRDRWQARASGLGRDVRAAVQEGREAMREREADLRRRGRRRSRASVSA